MLEYKIIRYLVYGTSSLILTELLYAGYKKITKKPERISEVIWTNDLSLDCVLKHNDNGLDLPAPSCANKYCSVNNVRRLIHYIDEARVSIDLAMYVLSNEELCRALKRALNRGVSLRIIGDKTMTDTAGGSQVDLLNLAGAIVCHPLGPSLMHHKFCIIDGPSRVKFVNKKNIKHKTTSILINGSMNWTMQGMRCNWENLIITSDGLIIREFESEFQRMWLKFQRDIYEQCN